jgi:hypothetical protein
MEDHRQSVLNPLQKEFLAKSHKNREQIVPIKDKIAMAFPSQKPQRKQVTEQQNFSIVSFAATLIDELKKAPFKIVTAASNFQEKGLISLSGISRLNR